MVVGLTVEKVSGELDVWAFGEFQMVERFCHEVEMNHLVVGGSSVGGSAGVLESVGGDNSK